MKRIFADTGYWTAVLNPHDALHDKAKIVSTSLGTAQIVTSEMVLTELLNYFAERGTKLRSAAVELVRSVQANPNCHIVPLTSVLFTAAFNLYAARSDKRWSLTDCASFEIMKNEGINDALAHDKHFEQAGFAALLR